MPTRDICIVAPSSGILLIINYTAYLDHILAHSCHREAGRRLLHSREAPGEIILHENSMSDIVALPHGQRNILFLSKIVAITNTCWCAHACTCTHLAESQMKSCRSLRLSAEHAEVHTSDTEGLHSNATSPTTMT